MMLEDMGHVLKIYILHFESEAASQSAVLL